MTKRGLTLTLLIIAAFVLFISAVKGILMPFVIGLILAYLLNPVANWLERRLKLPRELAAALPVTLAVALLVSGMAMGIPLLIDQLQSFVQRLPVYLMMLEHFVLPARLAEYVGEIRDNLTMDNLLRTVGIVGTRGIELSINALQRGYTGVAAAFDFVLLLVMTPLVAFYLVLDWPHLQVHGLDWLPSPWRAPVRQMIVEINTKLGAYLRGMVVVMLLLGGFYAIALEILGLEMGWAIGLVTGLLGFLPVIGAVIGVTLMMAVALVQFQLMTWEPYAALVVIYAAGQILEGYVLTPRLVGNNVGLHPLWVMFALLAGGAVAGILGMLAALPAAVVVSVVLPRILSAWQKSIDG